MTNEIKGITLVRMDPSIGPITEFCWARDKNESLEGITDSKSVVQLFTIAMLAETPRSMEFRNSKVLFSDDRDSNSLLAVHLAKNVKFAEQEKLWRRIRVIHGKSKGETEKLLDGLERMIKPSSC